MLNEGPVYIRTTSYLFLLTRGRPFVLPLLLLLAHSSARLTYSRRGRTLSHKLCRRCAHKAQQLINHLEERNEALTNIEQHGLPSSSSRSRNEQGIRRGG